MNVVTGYPSIPSSHGFLSAPRTGSALVPRVRATRIQRLSAERERDGNCVTRAKRASAILASHATVFFSGHQTRTASASRLGASAGMNHLRRRLRMESKQTPKKSKANVILAKTRPSAKLQGEGDYEAARRYDIEIGR